jgi:muramoyltetrapeptide carboxypeptidase
MALLEWGVSEKRRRDMKKVGVVALSSPCKGDIFEGAINYLKEQGYEVAIELDPVREYGKSTFLFSSDTPQKRAEALHRLFSDPQVDIVLSARGAYGSMEVLPYLDMDLLAKTPKPIVGFSDTTAILLGVSHATGTVCYHGPSLSGLSSEVNGGSGRKDFEKLIALIEGRQKRPFGDLQLEGVENAGEVLAGTLWGGNLTLCAALTGTPWGPPPENSIFFFEDVGVKPYALHRLLVQMELAGAFSGMQAVVVGSLKGCEHSKGLGPSSRDVIEAVFNALSIPVFWGAPFGHQAPNCPVPIGVLASISKDNILELC